MLTERGEKILHIVLCIILLPPMLLGALMVFGMMIENIGQHNEQHDRCLKNATNGYEIKQCR